jgi:catechol 2,3-dioxygenase-like lactoylglutathione lyase family enzyme
MRVLSHIALAVHEPERSSRFYRDVLGLDGTIRETAYGIAVLTGNGLSLTFLRGEPPAALWDFHLGCSVSTPGEVRSFREQISGVGISEVDWRDEPGYVSLRMLDPDGYVVEVFWEAEPSGEQ